MTEPEVIDTPVGLTGFAISTRKYELINGSDGFTALSISTNKKQFIELSYGFKGLSISLPYRGRAYRSNGKNIVASGGGISPTPSLGIPVISFDSITSTQVRIKDYYVPNAIQYVIYRSEVPSMIGQVEIHRSANTSYTDSSLKEGTTYYYRVAATAPGFTGSMSGVTSVKTTDPVILPQLGTPTFILSKNDNDVTININQLNNAQSFQIERSLSFEMTDPTVIYSGLNRVYVDNNLSYGDTYYYRITARASGYKSSVSVVNSIEIPNITSPSEYEDDIKTYIANAASVGEEFTKIELDALNDWVLDVKSIGIYNSCTEVYPLLGRNYKSAMIKLKSLSADFFMTANGTPAGNFLEADYKPTRGLTSDHDDIFFDITAKTVTANKPVRDVFSVTEPYTAFALKQRSATRMMEYYILGTEYRWNYSLIAEEQQRQISKIYLSNFQLAQNPIARYVHAIKQSADSNAIFEMGNKLIANTTVDSTDGVLQDKLLLQSLKGCIKFLSIGTGGITDAQAAAYAQATKRFLIKIGRELQDPNVTPSAEFLRGSGQDPTITII